MGTVFPFLELLFPNEHLLCKFPLKMFPAQLRAVEERGINVKLLDKGQEKELQRKIDKQKVLLAIDRMSGNVKNIFSLLEREVKKSSAEEKGKGTGKKFRNSTVFPKESADLVNQSDTKRKTVPFPIDYTKQATLKVKIPWKYGTEM